MRYIYEEFMDNMDDADVVLSDASDDVIKRERKVEDYDIQFKLSQIYYSSQSGVTREQFSKRAIKNIERVFNSRFFISASKTQESKVISNDSKTIWIGAEPRFNDIEQIFQFLSCIARCGCNTLSIYKKSWDIREQVLYFLEDFKSYNSTREITNKSTNSNLKWHVAYLYEIAAILLPERRYERAGSMIQEKFGFDVFQKLSAMASSLMTVGYARKFKNTLSWKSIFNNVYLPAKCDFNCLSKNIIYCKNGLYDEYYRQPMYGTDIYNDIIKSHPLIPMKKFSIYKDSDTENIVIFIGAGEYPFELQTTKGKAKCIIQCLICLKFKSFDFFIDWVENCLIKEDGTPVDKIKADKRKKLKVVSIY